MKQKKFHIPTEEKRTHQEQEFVPQELPAIDEVVKRVEAALDEPKFCPCGLPWKDCWRSKG